MRFHAPLLFVSVILIASEKPQAKKADQEETRFFGTWEVVAAEEDGKPHEGYLKLLITFKGKGEYEWNEGEVTEPDGETGRAVWWIHSSRKPKEIYFGFSLLIRPGIYELDGDKLIMCFSGRGEEKPPREFTGSKESGAALWRLKRVK